MSHHSQQPPSGDKGAYTSSYHPPQPQAAEAHPNPSVSTRSSAATAAAAAAEKTTLMQRDEPILTNDTSDSHEKNVNNSNNNNKYVTKTSSPLPYSRNDPESDDIPHFKYIPWLFRYDNAPPEATGVAMDAFGRGAVAMCSLFMGPALLLLARQAVYAHCSDLENCENGRIYGMKPSSLLTNIAACAGALSACLMPLIGAIVDHTPYRQQVGAYSAAALIIVKGLEISISAQTWGFIAILQVFSGVLYMIHLCASYAYTSELSEIPAEQTKYNTFFAIVAYISILMFLLLVVAFSSFLTSDGDDVGTARISQILTCVIATIFFGFAWTFLFRKRPALSQVPENTTLLRCGFEKIFQTSITIGLERPALRWFMCSIVFSESATSALVTIATTFMNQYLQMDSGEIGVIFLVVLLAGIPGSKIGEKIGLDIDPITSAKVCLAMFIATTAIAAKVLNGPETKQYVVIFAFLWGLELNWLTPMHTTIYMTVIPRGQESELMGMYLFCGQVLVWLPPLVFTVLNETGFSMSLGLASLNIFFVVALLLIYLVGDYKHAVVDRANAVSADLSDIIDCSSADYYTKDNGISSLSDLQQMGHQMGIWRTQSGTMYAPNAFTKTEH